MVKRSRSLDSARRQRGAALFLIIFLAAIAAMTLLVSRLSPVAMQAEQLDASAKARLDARNALLGYALRYRDNNANEVFGYFPCPGDPASANPGEAMATCNQSSRGAVGILPYKTLGLPDLRDAQGNCLWYAVAGAFKANPKGTETPGGSAPAGWVPLPLNWDTQGQFRILGANGTTLAEPGDVNGGAAVVIFAPGTALAEQNRTPSAAEPCRIDPNFTHYLDQAYRDDSIVAAESIAPNYNFATGQTPANQPITVQQGLVRDGTGNLINNDVVTWISPRELFDRVAARSDFFAPSGGNSGHIDRTLDEIAAVVESWMQNDLQTTSTPTQSKPANTASFAQNLARPWVGTPDLDAIATPGTTVPPSMRSYVTNWGENTRLAVCRDLSMRCLTIGGKSCRGGLFFGGRTANGQPRTVAQRALSTPLLAGYFEPTATTLGALDVLDLGSANWSPVFGGKTTYSDTPSADTATRNSERAADVGKCIFPGSFASLAQDASQFAAGVQVSTTTFVPAAVDTSTKTINLGNADPDPTNIAANSGCVWFPTPLPFGASLRVYFRVQVTQLGEGMTFTIADAATNLAPTSLARTQIMCGGSARYLGYAEQPPAGSSMGIAPPKMALELDTRRNNTVPTRNDPGSVLASGHMAFVYWGDSADNIPGSTGADDNQHWQAGSGGGDGTGDAPLNPRNLSGGFTAVVADASWSSGRVTITTAADHGLADGQPVTISGISPVGFDAGPIAISVVSRTQFTYPLATSPVGTYTGGGTAASSIEPGIATVKAGDIFLPYAGQFPTTSVPAPYNGLATKDGVIHVRMDINKLYSAGQGRYSMKAYVADRLPAACTLTAYMNLAKDLEDICSDLPQIQQNGILINDRTGSEAFANVYLGFTNGQSATLRQNIVISNFRARIE